MKRTTIALAILVTMVGVCGTANAAIISYWNENSNNLPSGAFGFTPSSFPQSADFGNGSLSLANFDTTTGGVDGAYTNVPSFAGTTLNAQFGDAAGGSLSPQNSTNNGMQILISVNTTGFTGIDLSWAQRGTGTGYNSRAFDYSTDGGGSFTPLAYTGDSGALGSSFAVVSPILTGITALENNPNVVFRLTLTGATSASGNNRFDNILVQGVEVPEPATAGLALIAGLAFAWYRRCAS
jgi:hypothetical protein